jgi:predicted alpha/beta-fold hydrolase
MEGLAIFALSVSTVSRHWYRRYHKPLLFFKHTSENKKRVEACHSVHNYEPPLLLDYYGHVHSAVCHIIRGALQVELSLVRELLTLSDGGTVGLDWVDQKPASSSTTPLVILFHGICGNSEDSHVVYAARALRREGFNVVTLISRGCGGVPLTTPASFNVCKPMLMLIMLMLLL